MDITHDLLVMPDWLQYVIPPLVLIAVMAGIIAYAFGGRKKDKPEPPEPEPESKPESGAERARLMRRLRRS